MTLRLKRIKTSFWCILLCTGFLYFLSGCSSEQDLDGGITGDEFLHFEFKKTETRATLDTDGSGSFSEGDKIGLYISSNLGVQYRELTFHDGVWTPLLRRSDFGPGILSLAAHYPAQSEKASSDLDFQIKTDQSASGKSESDLLFARTILEEGNYDAVFSFRHLMHRLRIELKGSVDNVLIQARSKTAGSVNLLTGEIGPLYGDFEWITPFADKNGHMEVIILPQAAEPYRAEEGLLKIKANDKEIHYMAPEKLEDGNNLSKFESGKETNIVLQLSEGNIDGEWANKKVWVYGIKEPEEGAWKQIYPNLFSTYYLFWKQEYGWYDCNKRNPSALPGGVPDGMMCWAASASNMLHWWISQNIEYVKKYNYQGPDYAYPLKKPQESDIFQHFINVFADDAGYIDEGINWFLHGIKPSYPPYDYPGNYGGYFKDVFPAGVKLSQNHAGMGKVRFNQVIKDALKNRKAIGVSAGKVRSSHAMTIWGAEFDEEGNVSYIYLADNNDRNQFEVWGVGCMRYQIVYLPLPEGGDMTHYKTGFYEMPNSSTPINRLVTVELGQEYWEEYLKK